MTHWRIMATIPLLYYSCEAVAETGPGDRLLQSFATCRAIGAPDARLDCFDKAATALERAIKAKDVTIVDRQEVRKVRRSLFGFVIPRLALFAGEDRGDTAEREEIREINTMITGVRPLANERVELRLAESEGVWVTTDPMPFPPKIGSKIRIRAGTLGNYFLAVSGLRTVRGMRLR